LEQATRGLSRDSSARVRAEIQEHNDSAREAALHNGATAEEASRSAVIALGDAKTVNCQYRRVLLTSAEARMLRGSNWEAKTVCSHASVKWALLAMPVAALFAAAVLFIRDEIATARLLLIGAIALGLVLGAPFLPVYTPSRGRIFRAIKWVVLLGLFGLAFGLTGPNWSWLMVSCLWPVIWIEWTRISIRRKLPVSQWPKQLYL
jgi:hypothetical protein